MSQSSARRTTSLGGTSRLALSVGKNSAPATATAGRHPLRNEWTISYMHRSPTVKVDYEKETKRVASFGSIESFLQLYTHLESPLDLQPVTDILIFQARISKPGIWEVMPEGGRFTFRLQHAITPLLYESTLFALIGDQFDESERVVGMVLSVRQLECLISVWVEEEGEAVKSGALRDKLLNLLNLPGTTTCEYRSNKTMLEAAASKESGAGAGVIGSASASGAANSGNNGTPGLANGASSNMNGHGYAAAPGGERDQRRNYHSNYHSHRDGHREGFRGNHRDNRDGGHGEGEADNAQGSGQGHGFGHRFNRSGVRRDGADRQDEASAGQDGTADSLPSAAGANGVQSDRDQQRPAPLSARNSTGRFGQFSHTPLAAGSGPGFGRAERGERAERGAWVRPRADQ